MITIRIPNWHPTPVNQLVGHWRAANQRKKADRNFIGYCMQYFPKTEKKRRVTLTIILGKGQRACDPDAYWKSLLDALVHAGQLVDDSRQWVEFSSPTFDRAEQKATIIKLEDLDDLTVDCCIQDDKPRIP